MEPIPLLYKCIGKEDFLGIGCRPVGKFYARSGCMGGVIPGGATGKGEEEEHTGNVAHDPALHGLEE
jgi:hypothetical protein